MSASVNKFWSAENHTIVVVKGDACCVVTRATSRRYKLSVAQQVVGNNEKNRWRYCSL